MRNELKNGIILSITVILIILVVYLTTAVFMTGEIGSKKSSEKKTTTTNAASSYENKILASKVFDQTPETYKVLIFSEQDVSDDLKSAITSYSGNTKLYLVNDFDQVLGLDLLKEEKIEVEDEIKELINKRNEAKKNKDFVTADQIRDLIFEKGYIIKDTREGVQIEKK